MGLTSIITEPIIRNVGAYEQYPFEILSRRDIEAWQRASEQLPRRHASNCFILLKLLECFLQISTRKLRVYSVSQRPTGDVAHLFIGALYSIKFLEATNQRRYEYAATTIRIFSRLYPQRLSDITASTRGATPVIQKYVAEFERLTLDPKKVELWRGWLIVNRSGIWTSLPLYPVWERLGASFATTLHQACADYYITTKSQRVPCMRELANYIGTFPGDLTSLSLRDAAFSAGFWRGFFEYYVAESQAAECSLPYVIRTWNGSFLKFSRTFLFPSGLFSEPMGSMPKPPARFAKGFETHIQSQKDGKLLKTKLLTHVPLEVTDTEALEILFRQIETDKNLVVEWAEGSVTKTWKLYEECNALASKGIVRKLGTTGVINGSAWLRDKQNPRWLENSAATLRHHGYTTDGDMLNYLMYPRPLRETAKMLGLPVTGTLLAHCTILVAHHPAITPAFLESLELFDESGQRSGFIKQDSGWALIGNKFRRGPHLAQQIIMLNDRTIEIVKQVIELTSPLRKYLKDRGDSDWRYLLITAGSGFSYPRRIKRIATDTSQKLRLKTLATEFEMACGIGAEKAKALAEQFSLPALRASCGVLTFIQTKSLTRTAEALGHKEYAPNLMARYLPASLLDFFQERWIRIFQEGIVLEAMNGSSYQIEASAFSDMAQVHQFLENHALNLRTDLLDKSDSSEHSERDQVFIGLNTHLLVLLLSLREAVMAAKKAVSGTARYWSELTEQIVHYIESPSCSRRDIQQYLHDAKPLVNPKLFEIWIYELAS